MPQDQVLFAARDVGYSELHLFLKSLERHGLLQRIVLVCPGHFFAVHPEPRPAHIDDDFADPSRTVDRVVDWVRENGGAFRGMIGVDEDLQFGLSRDLAARLGIPFFGEASCVRASNKFVQKAAFRRQGVPTSPFALSSDPDVADRVGFPCVVKAVTSYASQYMGRCDDRARLADLLERLRTAAHEAHDDPRFATQEVDLGDGRRLLDPRREFLVERFVRGEEYSCDFLADRDGVQVVRVARKVQGSSFGFFDGAILLGLREIEACGVGLERLAAVCRRIALALDIDAGVCMVDFRVQDGEIVVLESSIRPGLSATNHLVYELYGYTPLALLAMMLLGEAPEVRIPESGAAVVYLNAAHRDWSDADVEALRRRHGQDRVYVYDRSEEAGPVPENDPSALLRGYVVTTEVDGLAWTAVTERAIGGLDPH